MFERDWDFDLGDVGGPWITDIEGDFPKAYNLQKIGKGSAVMKDFPGWAWDLAKEQYELTTEDTKGPIEISLSKPYATVLAGNPFYQKNQVDKGVERQYYFETYLVDASTLQPFGYFEWAIKSKAMKAGPTAEVLKEPTWHDGKGSHWKELK